MRPDHQNRGAGAELVAFYRFIGGRLGARGGAALVGLLLATGLSEGVALMLLLPLLQAIGAPEGPAPRFLFGWRPGLEAALALFVAAALLRAGLARGSALYVTGRRFTLLRDLRIEVYAALAHADWRFLRGRDRAALQSALTSDCDRLNDAIYAALDLPARAIVALANFAIAALIAPGLTLLAAVGGAALAWLARRHYADSLRFGEGLSRAYAELHRQVMDFLAGLKLTKTFAAEERHVGAFAASLAAVDAQTLQQTRRAAGFRLLQEAAAALAVAGFIYVAVVGAGLAIADVLVLALILYRLLPMLHGLQHYALELLHAAPAARTLAELAAAARAAAEPTTAGPPLPLRRELRLSGLGFRHAPDRPPVLRGVDLTLPAGSLTALSGRSGAGKSTLLDLLAGLLTPESGAVTVDGQPLTDADLPRWRRSVAYVGQEAFLVHGTLRANLLIGDPAAGDAALHTALAQAGAADFVAALPDGLDTPVGESGDRFSGGERQRLALARALLRRPALLILDEPTSALDPDTEAQVLATVAALRGQTTILIVTHRPERVPGADQVLHARNGLIVPGGDNITPRAGDEPLDPA